MKFFRKFFGDDDRAYSEGERNPESAEGTVAVGEVPEGEGGSEKKDDVTLRVMRPRGYDDGPEIADYVASGCTVVMNIEDLNREDSRRIIDFLLGAVHVIGGDLQKASETTFVVAPCAVGSEEEKTEGNDSPRGFDFE